MIPEGSLVVLDTNVLVHLLRNKATGQRIEKKYNLSQRRERPLICIVTVGEIMSLARLGNWLDAIKMGKNDLWISATTAVTGAVLLTSDKDFDPLHNVVFKRFYEPPN